LERLDPDQIMKTMIESFGGDEKPLAQLIHQLIKTE